MHAEALVQVIEDGEEQIVLLTPGFELDSAEVVLERVGGAVAIHPVPRRPAGSAASSQ
ncbi:hypothetical protein [Caulobacter sp. S45]|uniref:hypothetical protein n=1 Tax=Caulobacter sp. S45 TaxID=1641861 RepID=UPI00131B296F|nr:hypothetical protein [Caulobacter sp. S45]